MNETLDSLFAKCQQLSDWDLETLHAAILSECDCRKDKAKKVAWAKVCEVITHYVDNYGHIEVSDYDNENVIVLYPGRLTFSNYSDIKVDA